MRAVSDRVQFPIKLQFLFEPHPYKIVYGGRLGLKSTNFARALLIMGAKRSLRVLCARETMNSMKESVHLLLRDQIRALGLEKHYIIQEDSIKGKLNDTLFTFAGLRHNVDNIKSLESYDIVWVEEAQSVSEKSWLTLLPTIRKEGAEVWVSFNPKLATDATYKRFVLNPPPGAVVVKTGWEDNPWLSSRALADKDHLLATDPVAYANVYGGECTNSVVGAIFGKEMQIAFEEGRIAKVPYNRSKPVMTVWDLGFGDLTSIWFVQPYDGWFNLIDYEQGDGEPISTYLLTLQNKKYVYDTHWVPHDAVDTIIHKKLAGQNDKSIEMIMREAGLNVRMVPKMLITDQINAARTIFPQCRFDEAKCADGLQALRHYQWGPPDEDLSGPRLIRKSKPLHDWASHASSAFQDMAIAVKQPKAPPREEENIPVFPKRSGDYAPFA